MYKRIRINLAFETADSRGDIEEEVLRQIGNAVIINEGTPEEERGSMELEDCGHNDPNEPCVVTDRWEVGLGKVI